MEMEKKSVAVLVMFTTMGILSACGSGGDDNNPPVAEAQFITIDEDVPKDIVLTGSDADGDPLSYKVSEQPAYGSISGTVPNLVYTPNADYNGEDTFSFTVNDGVIDSELAAITITINAIEDAPVATAKSVNTDEDVAAVIELTGSDAEGDTLTYTLNTQPSNGTLSGTAPSLSYTPDTNYNGTDSFTFSVNDGKADSEPSTINIVVAAVNDAPLAESESYTTDEDVAVAITLTGSDVDGDTSFTYSISAFPSNGSFNDTTPPNLTYTPNNNFYGTDTFSFVVNDGTVNSTAENINIVIQPVNDLSSGAAAAVVIGQANFDGSNANAGGIGRNTVNSPIGNPGVANGVLYLPDSTNNRILGFNSIPSVDNTDADFVLGQPDFSTTNTTLSDVSADSPQSVSFDENKMFVVDQAVNRVLIWNSIPTSGGVPADIVLGQNGFDTSASGGCTSSGLSSPESFWAANGKLIVADSTHNRVLIWNSIPTSNNVAADIVLGQQNLQSCGPAATTSASTLNYPSGVWTDGTRLVVLDWGNHRALIWNTFPSNNFTAADVIIGQENSTSNLANAGGVPTEFTLNKPYTGVFSNGRQLYIADTENNRVLIWNEFPTANYTPADVVLGQADFSLIGTSPVSATSLNAPQGIYQNGNQLIVSDSGNNRVLIYNEE